MSTEIDTLKRARTIVLLFVLLARVVCGQSITKVTGTVIDGESGEPLPFSAVNIEGSIVGTATNLEGVFSIKVPDHLASSNVVFSHLGYEYDTVRLQNVDLTQEIRVALQPALLELAEVTVRPLSPEEFIKRSVANIPLNYSNTFQAEAYFRQYGSDKGQLLQFSEGYIQIYSADFLNSASAIQQRLLLFNQEKEMHNLAFRKRKREKKLQKVRKKAEKKNQSVNEDSLRNSIGQIVLDVITPDRLVEEDPIRQIESFLDSTQFKAYDFEFSDDMSHEGKEVTIITFSPRKKVEMESSNLKGRITGKLYFERDTYALLGVDYDSELIIPNALRPLVFLAGYGVSNPKMKKQVRYAKSEGKWHIRSIQMDLEMKLTKRYWFKKNESSDIDMEILMSLDHVVSDHIASIPEKYQFDTSKDPESQVHPLPNISWNTVNRIVLESDK